MFKIITTFFVVSTMLLAVEKTPLLKNSSQKGCIAKAKKRTFQHNYKRKKLFRKLKEKCTQIANES